MIFQDSIINIRVSKETKEKLKKHALLQKIHLSSLLRSIAEKYVTDNGLSNKK